MICRGETIVYKRENGYISFYWLCEITAYGYVFFDWYADPQRPMGFDYWEVTKEWFDAKVKEGVIEVYDCLPEEYLDIFTKQATELHE